MTSNLGADRIQAHARRHESFEELKDELMDMLRQSFRPELLNRIDEIIVFRSLDRDQLGQITRLLLARVARRMHAQGVELEVSDAAVQYLANAGFDPQYGARPLRRAIQRLLEDELSERLLAGEIERGQRVRVDLHDGRLNAETLPATDDMREASETGAHA
jgi:ATP-dependent Clp protease ATP-binding subunit ClpC